MKKYIVQAKNNPLISGSIIIFFGTNLANVFNFLYSLFMSRMLSASALGELLSIISIITLFTVPANSLIPTIVNFSATFFAQNELGKLRGLFLQFGKLLTIIGGLLFILSIIFASQAAIFLKIKDPIFVTLAGLVILLGYVGTTNIAFLQAKLSFTFISIINLLGSISKFAFSLFFVSMGFGVIGALWGFVFAYTIPFLLSFSRITFVFNKNISLSKSKMDELVKYGLPATVALFCLTSFTSTDVILVKHFFSPEEAGHYAVISIVGRIIYYLTAPISSVMFPMVVQKYAKGEDYKNTFKLSVLLVMIPSIILTAFYFLSPDMIIRIIANKENGAYLGMFGLFITVFALVQVLTNFYLSINKTKVFLPILLGALLQIILIWFIHGSLLSVITISLTIMCIILFSLLLYYPYATKR